MGPLAVSLVFFSILQYSIAQQYYQVNLNNRLDAQTTSNNADSQNLLDDNPNTIWQSIDEVDNINISLTPKQSGGLQGFHISKVTVNFQGLPPQVLSLYKDGFQTHIHTYAIDCDEVSFIDCTPYDIDQNEIVFTAMELSVNSLNLYLAEFQNESMVLNFQIDAVTVLGFVDSNYYIPEPHSVKAEGEDGVLLTDGVWIKSSNMTLLPTFSGRGFADFGFGEDDIKAQWIINIAQTTAVENLVIRYRNKQIQSRWFLAEAMYNGIMCEIRFLIDNTQAGCSGNCFARVDTLEDCPPFQAGDTVTLMGQLGHANFVLDYFAAVPNECTKNQSFVEECNIFGVSADEYSDSCKQQAIQECMGVSPIPSCECVYSTNSSEGSCETLGGQCSCLADYLGKNCDLCPINYFSEGPEGCTFCDCPDNSDCGCASCSDGQCQCPEEIGGRTCDSCLDNYYNFVNTGCTPCNCSTEGSNQFCNKTTGECSCLDNVIGDDCSMCEEGYYNFSSNTGCDDCECNMEGSESINCNETGVCYCKIGYAGSKCFAIDEGYFSFNGSAYLCDCSNRTNDCIQNPDITDTLSELCNNSCPEAYEGDSCESCAFGYWYMTESDMCVECGCNESLSCNQTTGECFVFPPPPPPGTPPPPPPPLNCTPNTTGEYCDQCADEYYNSATDSSLICTECPCNLNSTVNMSCYLVDNTPYCYCLPGHEGSQCDTCSSGHYGMPHLFPCSTCECSGNINPLDPNACNKTSGVCLFCLNNSTGPTCGECMNGFYGNASNQDCESCSCNEAGSEASLLCDGTTGECNCLPGVNGEMCTECMDGYWNFIDNSGCQECNCNITGSNSVGCNITSGQCICKPGVEGMQCDMCIDEYYEFSDTGCKECDCNGGSSFNQSCNVISGQCPCKKGASSRQCDTCEPFYEIGDFGCQPCDNCTIKLLNTNSDINNTLISIDAKAVMATELQQADTLDLVTVQIRVAELYDLLDKTVGNLTEASNNLSRLNETKNNLTIDLSQQENLINYIIAVAEAELPNAEEVHGNVNALHNSLTLDFEETAAIYNEIKMIRNDVQTLVENIESVWLNITAIRNYTLSISFSDDLAITTQQTNIILTNYKYIMSQYTKLSNEKLTLEMLHESIVELDLNFNDLYANFIELMTQLALIENNITASDWLVNNLANEVDTVNERIAEADNITNNLQQLLPWAHEEFMIAVNNIEMLQTLIGLMESSGSGGSGLGVMDTLPDLIKELDLTVSQLDNDVKNSLWSFDLSLMNGQDVYQTSLEVQSILASSLTAGNKAVEAIIDYRSVEELITNASLIAQHANLTLLSVSQSLNQLMADGLEDTVAELNATYEYLYDQLIDLSSELQLLSIKYTDSYKEYETIKMVVDNATATLLDLSASVNSFSSNTSLMLPIINSKLDMASQYISEATDTYNTIKDVTHPQLLSDAEAVGEIIENTAISVFETIQIIEEANQTATEALNEFNERTGLLDEIESVSNNMEAALNEANTDLSSLLDKLEEVEAAAASIDIALRFTGNTSSSYPINLPSNEGSHVSLYFHGDVSSGTLLSTEGGVSLSVNNGNLEWMDGDTLVTTTDYIKLFDDVWYQVYASSMGESRYLSVAPLTVSENSITIVSEGVGSLPSLTEGTITIATNTNKSLYFTGCIDRVIVNGEMVPLLSASEATLTCGPRPASEEPFEAELGAWCLGQSSAMFSSYPNKLSSLDIYVRTFAESAFVFRAEATGQLFSLVISDGKPFLDVIRLDSINVAELHSSVYVDDGAWHKIRVVIDEPNVYLIVDNVTSTVEMEHAEPVQSPIDIHIGSYDMSSYPPFAGCIRNVSISGNALDLQSATELERIDTTGCPAMVTPGNRFMGTGVAIFPKFTDMEFVNSVSFLFNTDQIAAVLVHISADVLADELYISLYQTYIRVDFKNGLTNDTFLSFLSSQNELNNEYWHSVSFQTNINSLILTVDGIQVTYTVPGNFNGQLLMDDEGMFEVGGVSTPPTIPVAVSESFRGCLKDLSINDELQDFNNAISLEGVALYGCHGDILPLPSTTSAIMSSTSFQSSSLVPTETTSSIMASVSSSSSSLIPTPTDMIGSGSGDSDSILQPSPSDIPSESSLSIIISSSITIDASETIVSSTSFPTTAASVSSFAPSSSSAAMPSPSSTATSVSVPIATTSFSESSTTILSTDTDATVSIFSSPDTLLSSDIPSESSLSIIISSSITIDASETIVSSTSLPTTAASVSSFAPSSSSAAMPSPSSTATSVSVPIATTSFSESSTTILSSDTDATVSIFSSPDMLLSSDIPSESSLSIIISSSMTIDASETIVSSTSLPTTAASVSSFAPSSSSAAMPSPSSTATSVSVPIATTSFFSPSASQVVSVTSLSPSLSKSSTTILSSDTDATVSIFSPPDMLSSTNEVFFTDDMFSDIMEMSTIPVVISTTEPSTTTTTTATTTTATTTTATTTDVLSSTEESSILTTSSSVIQSFLSSIIIEPTLPPPPPLNSPPPPSFSSSPSPSPSFESIDMFVSSDIADTTSSAALVFPTTTSIEVSIMSSQLVSSSVSITPSFTTSMAVVSSSMSSPPSPSPSSSPFLSAGLNGLNNTFLAYSGSSFDLVVSYTISLVFRTASSNAVLLYNQKMFDEEQFDYFALEIKDGILYYSYNLGTGAVTIGASETRYDDNMQHNVTLTRNSRNGSLIVNNGVVVDGVSPGGHYQLNTENDMIYVGGVPNGFKRYGLFNNPNEIPPGALACFVSLTVNGVPVNLNDPVTANGMVDCTPELDSHVSFSGNGSYAIVDSDYTPLREYGFELEFRTLTCDGLLLYASSNIVEDHTALELYNGTVRFVFDNGGGNTGTVVYTPSVTDELCSGQWHSILVTKSGTEATLTVDNNTPITNNTGLAGFVSVNIDTPLYVGGVPDSVIPRYTVLSTRGFNGCLTNVQLITDPVTNTKESVHFSQSLLFNVELYTCHV